ncbi:NYN domain-containing protein [Halobacteriales archaeon QS_4_69_225]|nr:MAG: NYN domain-containing protein [Halobacteriales archaeon QS_4_69_225]
MGLLDGLRSDSARVGIFVDGPNVFRAEFDVDLDELRAIAREEGSVAVARVYVDENASSGLIQAAEARGFEVVTTSGDVDVRLAVDAVEAATAGQVDTLVVVSRDTDFKPVVETAAKRGLRTIAVAPGTHGRSDALRNAANDEITLG